jgi:hypothetical protein
MLILRRSWTEQPQEGADASDGFVWNAATGRGSSKGVGLSGVYTNAANSSVATTGLVTDQRRTVVVVFACPSSTLSLSQVLRIGASGPADGVRLDVTGGSSSFSAQWTMNGVANLNALSSGVISTFSTRAYVAVLAYDAAQTTSWLGPIGGQSPFDSGGISTGNTTAAMLSQTDLDVQVAGSTYPVYAVAILTTKVDDAEAKSIIRNPWQLFAPRQIWIPSSAASALPTLSFPTYVPGSLTSSAFRPRVTATWS